MFPAIDTLDLVNEQINFAPGFYPAFDQCADDLPKNIAFSCTPLTNKYFNQPVSDKTLYSVKIFIPDKPKQLRLIISEIVFFQPCKIISHA